VYVARPLSNAQEGESLVLVSESDIARLRVDSRCADLRANFNTAGFISGYEGSPGIHSAIPEKT
jgi:hypothetical protein